MGCIWSEYVLLCILFMMCQTAANTHAAQWFERTLDDSAIRRITLPEALRGALVLGDAAVERYRVFAVAMGLLVLAAMLYTLNRTKLGLLIRAGVQDREMVESLGYRIRRLFVGVFVAGSALAGLGGVMWGLYQQNVTPQIGGQVNVLIFIVIIISFSVFLHLFLFIIE